LDLTFGGKISDPLKARSLERRTAIAFVFEDPLLRDLQTAAPERTL
jgi:hypothetical protein